MGTCRPTHISSSLQSATAYFSTKCDKCYNRVRQRNVLLARSYVSIFQPLKYVIDTLNTAMFSKRWHFIWPLLVRLIRPCSMSAGILFGLSTGTLSATMFYECWYFIRFSTLASSLSTAMFLYVGILFSLSTSARPCSMYVGILFGLSTAMFYVYFGILVGRGGGVSISTLVQMVRPYSSMLVFYLVSSTLIRLVRPCSMYHISLNNNWGDYLLFRIKRG